MSLRQTKFLNPNYSSNSSETLMDQTLNPVWKLKTHSLKWREGNEKDNRSLEERDKLSWQSKIQELSATPSALKPR